MIGLDHHYGRDDDDDDGDRDDDGDDDDRDDGRDDHDDRLLEVDVSPLVSGGPGREPRPLTWKIMQCITSDISTTNPPPDLSTQHSTERNTVHMN